MAMTIRCPACRQTSQVRDELAGKRVRCRCGQVLGLPAATKITRTSTDTDLLDLLGDAASVGPVPPTSLPTAGPTLAPRRRTARSKKRRIKILLAALGGVASVLLLCCAGVAVLVTFTMYRSATPRRVGDPDAPISPEKAASLGTFMPDAIFATQLGPEVQFDHYAIRLPPGYIETTFDGPLPVPPPGGSSRSWHWNSQPTSSGSKHRISALVLDVGPNVNAKKYHESHMSGYLRAVENEKVRRRTEGWLSGRFAVRVESSILGSGKAVASRVDYFWFDGRRMVLLIGGAADVDGPHYLKQIEAALQTIRPLQQ
jgi:hypothetical protein